MSAHASLSYSEIAKAAQPGQVLFFQLYKLQDDTLTERRVRTAEELGYKAIIFTVDAIVAGHKERDIRSPWTLDDEEHGGPPVYEEKAGSTPGSGANLFGTAGGLVTNGDKDMTWEKVGRYYRICAQYNVYEDNTMGKRHHEVTHCHQRLAHDHQLEGITSKFFTGIQCVEVRKMAKYLSHSLFSRM